MRQPARNEGRGIDSAEEPRRPTSSTGTKLAVDASPAQPQRAAGDGGRTSVLSWILKAGAVASAIAAIVVLGKMVKGALSPAPPSVIRAAVTDIRTEPHRTEYIYFGSHPERLRREEVAFRREGLSPAQIAQVLQKRGVTVQFTVEPRGPANHAWYVTESLYNDSTGQREPAIEGNYLDDYPFVPHAGERAVTLPSWIQYPATPGVYFVEIEVSDKAGTNATGVSGKFRSPG
jgi:hypothetical protein